jgi:hypothetical protein
MVPVATLVKLRPINGSETASRYNLNSIGLNAIANLDSVLVQQFRPFKKSQTQNYQKDIRLNSQV